MNRLNPNSNFICPCCGQEDFTPSVIIMQGNYGSTHDTERVTVKVCGDCYDRIIEEIQKIIPTSTMKYDFTL